MDERENDMRGRKGITLIALIITVIVMLILARNKFECYNRGQWDYYECTNCKYEKWHGCVRGIFTRRICKIF